MLPLLSFEATRDKACQPLQYSNVDISGQVAPNAKAREGQDTTAKWAMRSVYCPWRTMRDLGLGSINTSVLRLDSTFGTRNVHNAYCRLHKAGCMYDAHVQKRDWPSADRGQRARGQDDEPPISWHQLALAGSHKRREQVTRSDPPTLPLFTSHQHLISPLFFSISALLSLSSSRCEGDHLIPPS